MHHKYKKLVQHLSSISQHRPPQVLIMKYLSIWRIRSLNTFHHDGKPSMLKTGNQVWIQIGWAHLANWVLLCTSINNVFNLPLPPVVSKLDCRILCISPTLLDYIATPLQAYRIFAALPSNEQFFSDVDNTRCIQSTITDEIFAAGTCTMVRWSLKL